MGRMSFCLERLVPQWVEKFNNTFWSPDSNTSWNGSAWVENGPPGSIRVDEVGSWNVDYEPTKVRITGTVSYGATLTVRTAGGTAIGSAANGTSVEIDLNWALSGGDDLRYMTLYGMSSITNIEFLEA